MPAGAALGSLAPRFCWQGQHLRLWSVPERVSGPPPPLVPPGAALGSLAPRFCWQGQHLRLWTVPERVWVLDAARRGTREPRASFLLAGAALEALDGARARFGAPLPRLWTVPERVSGPPHLLMLPGAALGSGPRPLMLPGAASSFAARFCWQGQHFSLWTVPELRLKP